MINPAHKQFLFIIRISCIFLFLGRGWQHLFWDAPFRTILWDQSLLGHFIETFTQMTWQEYVTSPITDKFISLFTGTLGCFYLITAVICIFLNEKHIRLGKILIAGSISLFLLSFIYYISKSWRIGMLIEHATQFGIPLVLYITLFKKNYIQRYLPFMKALIALTFVGHGLFAIGYHPVPGKFVDMIISTFGVSETNALLLLKAAATFDFLAAISLFIPPLVLYALGFNIFWGMTTAFARIVAHFDFDLFSMSIHQWALEVSYRLPHGLLPLALFISLKNIKKLNKTV